jgi:hypothetical protein
MNKKINYRFASIYYRDIYHFTSEVIHFVKEFKQLNTSSSFYSKDNRLKEMETDELNLVHVIPDFIKQVHLEYSLNDRLESDELILIIEKDIKSYLDNSPNLKEELLVISFSQEFETIPNDLTSNNKEYQFIYQFNSNYHFSVESMLGKVQLGIKKYFDNPELYVNLTSDIFTFQKSDTITIGEIVNSFESPVELAFDLNDYPDEKTMYETILNTLTLMNLFHKPKDLTLVIKLVFCLLPK